MYEEFYKLKAAPFRLSPDPAFVCMTEQHREALSGLVYSVCTRPGLSVLVGEAGTGKTTILYTLVGLLQRRHYLTVLCTNPTLNREEFYEFLLLKAGVNCATTSKTRQLIALEETLERNRAHGRLAVLIIDEAQRLSGELLEEIRLLSNLETPREKLLEIVLAGQPELSDTLRRPEFRQFKQRVSCICSLSPLNIEQVEEYINHRLLQAGSAGQPIFSDDAIGTIHAYSQGIPRLINTLADTALRIGFALQSEQITGFIIEEAARELALSRFTPEEQMPADSRDIMAHLDARLDDGVARPGPNLHDDAPITGPVPLESYASRQRSLGFFSEWIARRK